nr:hypothetical protein [uncultured Desulfobacter sp.]
MKKSSIIVAACLVVCGLFLTQPAFAALYSGPWQSTDNSIMATMEFSGSTFGFYDYNDESSYQDLTNGSNTFSISGDQVKVTSMDGSTDLFEISLNDGAAQFGFYMKEANGSTVTFYKEADVTYYENSDVWALDFDGKGTLLLGNAFPSELGSVNTPVPTAMLLLGSGLVGLVGFKRKSAQS